MKNAQTFAHFVKIILLPHSVHINSSIWFYYIVPLNAFSFFYMDDIVAIRNRLRNLFAIDIV